MSSKEWKERAKGDIKLLKSKATGRVRCLVRQEKTLKVRANFVVAPELELKGMPGSDKSYIWSAMDGSDDSSA